jgi:hypothetical protein
MKLFWTLYTIDTIAALIIFFFFLIGLSDGTVSSRNAGTWVAIILVLGGILAGSYYFQSQGKITMAYVVVSLLAIPALIMLLYTLFMVFGGGRWN